MIHAFIDCDVIIDLLTRREPHFKESALVFQAALDKRIQLFTSPLAIANVHYMVKKIKMSNKHVTQSANY
jgi:predicted nucleic acid-binding protein